jgi:prepilin-type N-terminal cleavage/methylation domain-containing protein
MIKADVKKKIAKGFTLVELLLVVSLTGIAFGVTSDILISIVRSQAKTQIMNNLEQQANFFSLKFEKDLRNAYAVEQYDVSGNGVKISGKTNGVMYEIIYYIDEANGVLRRQEGGSALLITSNTVPGGVKVSCIGGAGCFNVFGTNPTKVAINIKFEPATSAAQAVTPSTTGFVDIKSTFVVRGTY